jgi:hypothetical protein
MNSRNIFTRVASILISLTAFSVFGVSLWSRHTLRRTEMNTVFEAAGMALTAFNSRDCEDWMSPPGAGTTLEVEVHAPPVTRAVTVDRVTTCLAASGSPAEVATKHRIRKSLENQKR